MFCWILYIQQLHVRVCNTGPTWLQGKFQKEIRRFYCGFSYRQLKLLLQLQQIIETSSVRTKSVTKINILQLRGHNIIIHQDEKKHVQIKHMVGTATFHIAMKFQGLLSAVMKSVKSIQDHVVKNVMCIYLFQKLRIASNIFIGYKYSF